MRHVSSLHYIVLFVETRYTVTLMRVCVLSLVSIFHLSASHSSHLRHLVNMGWASAPGRSGFLCLILSLTKCYIHKPLTIAAANKMDFYWCVQNKTNHCYFLNKFDCKILLACQNDFQGTFGRCKCNFVHGILYYYVLYYYIYVMNQTGFSFGVYLSSEV